MESIIPTLTSETIEAVVRGFHGDAFSVLGPHSLNGNIAVRAFLPQAETAEVIVTADGSSHPMTQVQEAGFFEAILVGYDWPVEYQFRLTLSDGGQVLYEDPYSFPDLLSDYDEYLLAEGTHARTYEKLGAHIKTANETDGVLFSVWAPNAIRVSVIGDFNNWDGRRHSMRYHAGSGIWNIFIPGLSEGALYKYEVGTRYQNYTVAKTDPMAFFNELRPNTASVVWDIGKYKWRDRTWMESRGRIIDLDRPINVYEVHLGSWKRNDNNEWLTYKELAEQLVPYVKEMGFTHIELLPVAEHPYDGSWGYQVTGYFAPTSRFGTPEEFMTFVDACHQENIGVILDWVPAHFPRDQHGLAFFDGTYLYEHADPRQGAHPDWGTLIFNFGRTEVRQFLISNALFWLDKYHIDGLRVDAVASMLYLDFSREEGDWIPNRYGGRENLEAIDFIKDANRAIHEAYPDVLTIAEESTAWAGVTRPVAEGGLGFNLKWNMGWMHDTLQYISNDPIYRAFHHGTLTFSLLYAFTERFLLSFSHDEVVHLKKSMLDKMPGDKWRKFANLRALYAYQFAHPGKKMIFMGGEFGQWKEWTEKHSLDWHLLEEDHSHLMLQDFVRDLNHLYQIESALYEDDYSWDGFTWIDLHDAQRSILAFARHAPSEGKSIYVVCNFTPVMRENYRLGVMEDCNYREFLNSDKKEYGGSGITNDDLLTCDELSWNDLPYSVELTLPPLAVIYLQPVTS